MSSILDLYASSKIQKIEEATIEMERAGFMIDPEYCNKGFALAQLDEAQILKSLRDSVAEAGVQWPGPIDDIWTSSVQLPDLLENHLGLPPSPYKTKGRVDLDAGKRSTDKRALDWILSRIGDDKPARQIVRGVTELRRVRSSAKYLEKLPRFIGADGFIHPICGPAGDEDDAVGAVTGRYGMKKPEAQQIPSNPKKDRYFIRRAFVAPQGMRLVVSDYTALEVVVLANICEDLFGDTLLLDLTAPGQDIHAYNAHGIFGTHLNWVTDSGRRIKDFPEQSLYKTDPELAWYRETVKAVWYKLQYGGTVHGFATSLLDKDGEPIGKTRAEEIVEALYAACPSIKKWHNWVAGWLRKHKSIVGLGGRVIDYTDLIARGNWGFEAACRGADNGPMQMTGADTIGSAMVAVMECPEMKKLGAIQQLQIHDELQLRAPADNCEKAGHLLQEHMENAFPLKNLRAEWGIGDCWANAKGKG